MRLLLTTDAVGGVWDYTVTLAQGVLDAGHEVVLAAVGDPGEERLATLPAGVEALSRPYRLEWMAGAGDDVEAAGAWLAGLARERGADVVHLNQMAYTTHDFGAPTVVVVHSDVLSWFSEARGVEAPPEWGEYARRVRDGLAAATRVVAPSAYQSGLALRHYGRGADRVIHNGVRPPAGEPPPRAPALLVSAGRAWDEAKGMRTLDRALAILGDAAPPAHLFGALDGPQGERFRPERLTCHGRAERRVVDAWMRRASLYVGPSLYEPFGLAPLEAALHGCALVLSDIPSFRELWPDCAVFFPPGDADALAATLAELAPDRERCRALAHAARAHALRHYDAARFTARYLGVYDAVRECEGSA